MSCMTINCKKPAKEGPQEEWEGKLWPVASVEEERKEEKGVREEGQLTR